MGRTRKFSRDEVLERALPVFWQRGFADTSVQDLEKATRVNKSGLYSEFEGKEDLFVSSLQFYFQNRGGKTILSTEPLGWDNIERFLKIGQSCPWGKGCFAVDSFRELSILPPQARAVVDEHWGVLKALVIQNIEAEQTTMEAERIADIFQTIFFGYCLELNLETDLEAWLRKGDDLMGLLRSL